MSKRFLEHEPECAELSKIIKEKEEVIEILEGKARDLEKRHSAVKAESLEILEFSIDITAKFKENVDFQQKIKEEQVEKLQKEEKVMRIKKWIQKNMGSLGVKVDRSTAKDSTIDNFQKLIKTIQE